jgi:glycosyltransferase involved in cell wall biosynthesis
MEVEVLTSPTAVECNGVHLIKTMTSWRWRDMMRVVKSVRKFSPDIVHIQYPTTGYGKNIMPFWIPLIVSLMGIHVVQTWHEPLRWRSLYWYLPAALVRGGLVVAEPDFTELVAPWVRPFLAHKQVQFIPVGSSIPRVNLSLDERAAIRSRFCNEGERLIVYFGFASSAKRIEILMDIADLLRDRLVLLCELDEDDQYQKMILDKISSGVWRDRTVVTGYLPPDEVGSILAAADAAVFPFANGVAYRNTSFLAAKMQGTFVLTTSRKHQGYSAAENVFYAKPDDVPAMRQALEAYTGGRLKHNGDVGEWSDIARQHLAFYQKIIGLRG